MRRIHPKTPTGFTLVELLIVLALGGTALGVAATVLVRNIRSSINLEQNQQALNELGRIAAFIELEVGEAAAEGATNAIRTGVANPCGATGSPQEAFTLTLPNPGGISRTIQYYTIGSGGNTTLWRCGPPVLNNGTLNYNVNPTAFPLGFNLSINIPPVTIGPRGEFVRYTLASTEPGLQPPPTLTSTVRIRSNRVVN
jgi:prepilin-type N-terminal cleavage/methylation domain-containing protein